MITTIFGFLLICMAIQAFGYIIGMGAVAVKEVQAHHQMGKDPAGGCSPCQEQQEGCKVLLLDVPSHGDFCCVDGKTEGSSDSKKLLLVFVL